MAKATTLLAYYSYQEEILSFPQRLWSLHRGFQGFKKVDRGTDLKMEAIKICEKGCARTT